MPWVAEKPMGRWVREQPTLPDGTPAVPFEGAPGGAVSPNENYVPPDPLRGLKIGFQGAGRGLANLAGAPVDLMTGAINAGLSLGESAANLVPGVDNADFGRITSPVGGSESIADYAGQLAAAAGVPPIERADMDKSERVAYDVNAGVAGAAIPTGALYRAGAQATSLAAPKALDFLTRPYAGGSARPVVGDLAAGAGSAASVGVGHDYLPQEAQGPMTDLALSLAGGVGGAGLASVRRAPDSLANFVTGMLPDTNAPYRELRPASQFIPAVKVPFTRAQTRDAARAYQYVADDPAKAAKSIKTSDYEYKNAGLPTPSTGILSEDMGLLAFEQGMRAKNPLPFQKSDQAVRTAAANRVKAVTPEDAKPEAVSAAAQAQAKQMRADAADKVAAAQRNAADAVATEQKTAEPYRSLPSKGTSSAALDEVLVEKTMRPMQKTKNEMAAAIPDEQRDLTPFMDAVSRVERSLGALNDPAKILPEGTLARIKALAPAESARPGTPQTFKVDAQGVSERVAGEPSTVVQTGGKVSSQDLNKLRPELAGAIKAARKADNPVLAENLIALRKEINADVERMAAEGNPQAKEFVDYYKEKFAPYFATGTGGKLRDKVNRGADRTDSPPTATAEMFLFTGAGSKEAAADLERILSIAPNPEAGRQAARNYVLADMSKAIQKDGAIDPLRLKDFVRTRRDMLSSMPDLQSEVDKLVQDVVNGRAKSNSMAQELKKRVGDAKLTEREIQNGAISLLLDKDPEIAVRHVFADTGKREQRMSDIMRIVGKDKVAAEGWKRVVGEYLSDRVSSSNSGLTDGDAPHVLVGKLAKELKKNEKLLSQVFSPDEMNSLQQVQRLLEPYQQLSLRATVGSPTVENKEQMWRVFEALWKVNRGMIRGGGEVRSARLAASTLPDNSEAVNQLLVEVHTNPALAKYLLNVRVEDIGTPTWNKWLNRVSAVGAASRASAKPDQKDTQK